MEEEHQEFSHVCKLCSKSFPCGRSLGGHMRSHMTSNKNSADADDKLNIKRLSSLTNGGTGSNAKATETGFEAGTPTAYGLRENPKKTWRFTDSNEDTSRHHKVCRDCGKGFQSWKALFGHMKCHSEKERVSNNNSLEEQDSWTSANNKQKMVMDSQSDNETVVPSRRKRSKRVTGYMTTACSSSLSLANASSSVSEIEKEQEQEDVAMCLMMLSRDVGHWGGLNCSGAEFSDNNSVILEAPSSIHTNPVTKIEGKNPGCNGGKVSRLKKLSDRKLEISRNGSKPSKAGKQSTFEYENSETGLDQTHLGSNSSKRKHCSSDALDSEFIKNFDKGSKFECATCSKIFHSYQALGGHRASHKKIKGCFASKIDSSDNSIDTELSPDPTADSKLIKSVNNGITAQHLAAKFKETTQKSYGAKKSKGHECRICLKVFPSGQALGGHRRSHLVGSTETKNNQALGGHRRSHLVGSTETKNNQTIVIEKPIPEIRDFLDLNLPAPDEEESNGHLGFKPWWIGSSHEHEQLVGLISN